MPIKKNSATTCSMKKPPLKTMPVPKTDLFERVVSILEEAKSNVVRAVNSNMVIAYWPIGREIVEEIQHGKGRAEYGEKVAELTRVAKSYPSGSELPQGFSPQLFDGLFVAPDDNPTIGLILCTEKNETVARYSVLNDRKQIFASKYMLCIPTEDELRLEINKERRLLDERTENAEPQTPATDRGERP